MDEMEAVHGLITHTGWGEINATLKERHARAKKPVARDALSLLRIIRRSGASAIELAHRLGEGTRIINKKVREAVDNINDAAVTTRVFDELLRELLMQQVPERTRTMLKAVTAVDWQVVERRLRETEIELEPLLGVMRVHRVHFCTTWQ
jgi:hypothetical protein